MLIYKLINTLNGKIYIGKTKNSSVCARKSSHKSQSKRYEPRQYIHKAIKKYGWENFKIEIVEDGIDSLEILNKREKFFIREYDSANREKGYNLTLGGDGGHGLSGEKSGTFGMKRPDLSERNRKNKGKTLVQIHGEQKASEIKNKMVISSTGKVLSEKAKANSSKARKLAWENGTYDKPETRAKYTLNNKGNPSIKRIKVYSPELNMEFASLSFAAAHIKTHVSNVSKVLNGTLKHIKGYTFSRVVEDTKNVV